MTPTDIHQAGIRANAYATGIPLLLTLIGLAPIGAAVAYYFIHKAQSYGNPAITGRIVFALTIFATIIMLLAGWLIYDAAMTWQQQIEEGTAPLPTP